MRKILFVALLLNSCIESLAFQDGKDCAIANGVQDPHTQGTSFLRRDTVVPVKIELEKTSFNEMVVLFISDTAKQTQEIGSILGKDYAELMRYAKEDQLKPKKFLAWYYSVEPPWRMDIAVETEKVPSELRGRVKFRMEKGGEVLIAHMQGPYSELRQAYIQIENWLKQNGRVARGNPFEVYLNDPFTVKGPSEIQTDIYQPLQ